MEILHPFFFFLNFYFFCISSIEFYLLCLRVLYRPLYHIITTNLKLSFDHKVTVGIERYPQDWVFITIIFSTQLFKAAWIYHLYLLNVKNKIYWKCIYWYRFIGDAYSFFIKGVVPWFTDPVIGIKEMPLFCKMTGWRLSEDKLSSWIRQLLGQMHFRKAYIWKEKIWNRFA